MFLHKRKMRFKICVGDLVEIVCFRKIGQFYQNNIFHQILESLSSAYSQGTATDFFKT